MDILAIILILIAGVDLFLAGVVIGARRMNAIQKQDTACSKQAD